MKTTAAIAGLATSLALTASAVASDPAQKIEEDYCEHYPDVGTVCVVYRGVSHMTTTPTGALAVAQNSRSTESFVGEGEFAKCEPR